MVMGAMRLPDVRRIRDEETARALWQKGGEGLTVAAVEEIIARKETAAAWVALRTKLANGALLALAAALYVWGFLHGQPLEIWAFAGIFYGFLLWASGWILILSRYPVGDDVDLAFAKRLRRELEREKEGIALLRGRAARNEMFALYLRTFSAETKAMTAAGLSQASMAIGRWDGVGALNPAGETLMLSRDTIERIIELREYEWAQTHQIVAAIAAVLPIVCLGNIELQEEKRADLTKLGVVDVTVVTEDWWPLFQELEAAAIVTFVVLDSLSREISRELEHLMAKGRPFIVVCNTATDTRLAGLHGYRALLAHPAVRHVVFSEDLAPLQSVIANIVPSARPRSDPSTAFSGVDRRACAPSDEGRGLRGGPGRTCASGATRRGSRRDRRRRSREGRRGR